MDKDTIYYLIASITGVIIGLILFSLIPIFPLNIAVCYGAYRAIRIEIYKRLSEK